MKQFAKVWTTWIGAYGGWHYIMFTDKFVATWPAWLQIVVFLAGVCLAYAGVVLLSQEKEITNETSLV